MGSNPQTVIEGFAGPGGWDEGARLIGLNVVILGHEKDKAAAATARAAGFHRIVCDVTGVAYVRGAAWGYIGSPPCQPFSTAGKGLGLLDQPAIFAHLDRITEAGEWIDYPRDGWHDDKSPLVLEVVRAILQLRPTWVALEQVPEVLPFWQRVAVLLTQLGYRTWCGILNAEMYGVPQTRKRAILTASLDPAHNVGRPPATHERYRSGVVPVVDLFGELLPPVSMAQALGWGMVERPGLVISHAGQDGGSGARASLERERERERGWLPRVPTAQGCGDD